METGLADVNAYGISPSVLKEELDKRRRKRSDEESKQPTITPKISASAPSGTQRVLLVPSSSFINMLDRFNPDVFPGAFPTLFPFGVGGPAEPRRQPIALPNYAMHLMRLADRRFSCHAPFAFTLFNLVQRQRVKRSASQSLLAGRFVDFHKDLSKLSDKALTACIDDLRVAEKKGKYATWHHCKDKETRQALQNIFKQINTVAGRLPLTDMSKSSARHEIFGMDIKLGLPDFFITVNPEDRHAPLSVSFCGPLGAVETF